MSWLFKPPESDPPSSPIAKHLRAAADFLAPPPHYDHAESSASPTSQALIGMRNDLAELGDSLRSGFTKFTSTIWSGGGSKKESDDADDEYDGDDVASGLTEEVLDFVELISMRPQYWTDFPLSLEDDFMMSDAQKEHASTIEDLVPSFKDLRANLRDQLSDVQFWMVYFILLLPRLNDHDFKILSTPPLVEKRNALVEKLQKKRDANTESSVSDTFKSSRKESKVNEAHNQNFSPRENEAGGVLKAAKASEIEEEEEAVSFSEYEDAYNDLSRRTTVSRQKQTARPPSPAGSSDWVRLNESYGPVKARKSTSHEKDSDAESSDWFKVGDSD